MLPAPRSTPPAPASAPFSAASGSAAALEYLRRLVYAASAIVLDRNKDYLFESRLTPLLIEEGIPSFAALVEKLGQPGITAQVLKQRVVEAMTTNETFFFRDVHPFEAMRKVVLPQLAETNRERKTLSIWSAASSSGQEIYSLAMLIREQERLFPGWSVRLVACDLSTEILAKARAGVYSQMEVNRGLPAPMLIRHFEKAGLEWRIKEDLRRMVEFRPVNLIEPLPALPAMDVIFLRNVLIYFDIETKRRILEKVATVLRPGGLLFLGGVETTIKISARFAELRLEKSTCYRLLP